MLAVRHGYIHTYEFGKILQDNLQQFCCGITRKDKASFFLDQNKLKQTIEIPTAYNEATTDIKEMCKKFFKKRKTIQSGLLIFLVAIITSRFFLL